MKNFAIIHILLLVLMLLAYSCAIGQTTEDQEDYLVTNTMDTIYGKIKPMDYRSAPNVQVQTNDAKKTYTIFEIMAFTIKGETYNPVQSSNGYAFMKLISLPGYLSLYAFKPENQNSYNGRLLRKMDGSTLEVPNLGFKKHMSKFLDDCGTISERISSGELSRGDLDKIIDEYNTCITDRTTKTQATQLAKKESIEKSDSWKSLQEKIKSAQDFEGKSTALEMVTEVINKISAGDKVPTFVIDGLKNVLKDQENLKASLDESLKSLEK